MFNTGFVKIKYFFFVEPNFGKMSRKTAMAGKSIFLDSSIIAKTLGLVSCLVSIVDPKLYPFEVIRVEVYRCQSVAEDTFFQGRLAQVLIRI